MQTTHCKAKRGKLANSYILPAVVILLLLAACASPAPVSTETSGGTGYTVAAKFAEFYEEYGGQRIFGDPIRNGFDVPDTGLFSQYFRNMRLDYDEAKGAVVIFPLGSWALAGLNELNPAPVPEISPSRYFPETDLIVQDEFLSFYETHHGELLLGPPISVQVYEGDLRVQYFENGRLEWHPELPLDQRIQLGYLGQAHFDDEMVFAYREFHQARPVANFGITQADILASVRSPVLYTGEEQILYITVLTLEGNPVEGVRADLLISYGDFSEFILLEPTNAQGRIVVPLPALEAGPKQKVHLRTTAYAPDGSVIGASTITFTTWW